MTCSQDGQCTCAVDSETVAGYLRFAVTWPDNLGVQAGSGVVHLWTRNLITYNGGAFSSQFAICGVDIPDLTFTPIAGGGKLKFDIPEATFELTSPPMPLLTQGGSSEGFHAGAAFVATQSVSLLGCTLADPSAAWPASRSQISSRDDDGDVKPGLTAQNRNGNGYVYPKTSILGNARADKMYLAARVIFSLNGTRQTCTTAGGTATVPAFNYHVVGCHVSGGADCDASQADVVDGFSPVMSPGSGSWKSVRVPVAASCAQVRAALPLVP